MVKITGAQRHSQRLKRLPKETVAEVGKAIFVGASLIETEARRSIIQNAIQGAGHVPSAPGEPPNRDTGTLDRNVEARRTGELTAEALSQAPYSAALEFGTSRMAERPFMRPATQANRKKITALARRAVDIAVKKS